MEKQLEEIRDQQKASWNKFSPGWKKWDELFMEHLEPMGAAIIQQLQLKDSDVVLDIAAGTGEPGLTIASQLKGGKVIITDLADDMLVIARENAAKKGVTNVEFRACDASELPFADNSFDAVSCRLGFMFFPDMLMAAKEIFRVLKPGGRISTSVWNVPEKNFWVTAIMGPINRNMEIAPPPPGAPGLFRCAKDDVMENIFLQAGFKNISQTEITGKLNCKTTDVYWTMMTELAAAAVAALSKADDTMKEKIKTEVYQAVNQKYPDGNVIMESSSIIICGQK
jgi:ubiquinone/menaquinone biosynthesis C-methylase UbiE